MKRSELIEILKVLKELENVKGATKLFSIAVATNTAEIIDKTKIIYDLFSRPLPKLQEYENERTKLCEKYAKKDNEGNAKKHVDERGIPRYVIDEKKQKDFDLELEELGNKYKDTIQLVLDRNKELANLLNENVKTNLVKLDYNSLPDFINPKQINILMPILNNIPEQEVTNL